MNVRFLPAIFAGAALAIAGVATAQVTSAQQTGYLQDYHRLGHVGGVPLEQVWINPSFDIRAYRTLYIAPTRIDPSAYYRMPQMDSAIATQISNGLRATLTRQLQGAGIFAFASDDPYFSAKRPQALTLETRITEIYSGNAEERYSKGFGNGHTIIQIEGKIIENRTCRTLVEFADRRIHPGDAMIIGREKSADSAYLISLDTNGIMRGIIQMFIYLREEGPPANQR
jgi:hypothetical protein